MTLPNRLQALRPDPFTLAIVSVVVLASVLPARGLAAEALGYVVQIAIAVLFFLYGARAFRASLSSRILRTGGCIS